jgi:putative hydrolase of the HAD superfamily
MPSPSPDAPFEHRSRGVPRALTFDYWDTLYDGAGVPLRDALRVAAVQRLTAALGLTPGERELLDAYEASGAEAHRWWKDEHRGYTTGERIRWMLRQLGSERPETCEHVAEACSAVDEALLSHPPPLVPGAADTVRALAERFPLAIISDTGFASGRAQDELLERDGLLELFPVRIYSMDIGHAKPRPEPFDAAVRALGVTPGDAMHVGDIERTDVAGALSAGLRAVRCDVVPRRRGSSAAELVVREYGELVEYLEAEGQETRGLGE